jgi:cytidine deaminase
MTFSDADLIERAADAASRSYSPYSHFRVGAAIVTDAGDIITGANIENAAFGASVCAETNAITTAAASGVRRIDTVGVVCLDGDPCTPCGDCRQVMREFGVARVVMRGRNGAIRVMTLDQLLPASFGPEALEPEALET